MSQDTPTATESIAAETPTPTPTEGHHGPPHSIMLVGSTEDESGALTVNEVPIAYVVDSACLGGSGETCDGGVVVYTGTSPGFDDLDADDPTQPIYVLPEGVEISIEITAVDTDASVLVSGVVLDEVGETAVVNSTGHLHNHPTWQIVAPGGEVPADKQISFRLHGEGFESSGVITVTLSLFEEEEEHTPTATETPIEVSTPTETDTPVSSETPAVTETATEPVAVETPTVTPTEGHHGPPHSIMLVGSTEAEGGALTVNDVPVAYVVASACVGGSGDDCEGGFVVYSETSPGFDDLEEDDPNEPIYVLPEGVEISIEITAVDADASVLVSGVVLDEVGETAVVNSTGHLHNHPTWQIVAPAGEVPADKEISFVLHAEGFESSEEIAVTVSLFDEDADGGGHSD